jgi:hypothetical protein
MVRIEEQGFVRRKTGVTVRRIGMRVADQETARVVAISSVGASSVTGAGCLITSDKILTCLHVVASATGQEMKNVKQGDKVDVRLVGVKGRPKRVATVEKIGEDGPLERDLALLTIVPSEEEEVIVPPVEFATPFRHAGKGFSVLGFPDGAEQGRNAFGTLNAADAFGLVQMNKDSAALEVKQGYSGAPVWSPEIGAFVGLVVTEQRERGVSWCIPSRLLCDFYNDLRVRFRIPQSDRPAIHDYGEDDPNAWLFGVLSEDGSRRLSARVVVNPDEDSEDEYKAYLTYECLVGAPNPRGHYVTFITHPSFVSDGEDAYELFSTLEQVTQTKLKPTKKKKKKIKKKANVVRTEAAWKAEMYFYLEEGFTVAAIGDAGETVLTINLSDLGGNPEDFE